MPEWYCDLILMVVSLIVGDITWDVLKWRRQREAKLEAAAEVDPDVVFFRSLNSKEAVL